MRGLKCTALWISVLVLFFITSAAHASPILYTFNGTTASDPSFIHSESFQLLLPDFLPIVTNGPHISFLSTDTALISCSPCIAPPTPALFLAQADTNGPIAYIQFNDINNTGYLYYFPLGVFSSVGTYQTIPALPGQNPNIGTLVVAAVPEPASLVLLSTGLGVIGLAAWRRKKQ